MKVSRIINWRRRHKIAFAFFAVALFFVALSATTLVFNTGTADAQTDLRCTRSVSNVSGQWVNDRTIRVTMDVSYSGRCPQSDPGTISVDFIDSNPNDTSRVFISEQSSSSNRCSSTDSLTLTNTPRESVFRYYNLQLGSSGICSIIEYGAIDIGSVGNAQNTTSSWNCGSVPPDQQQACGQARQEAEENGNAAFAAACANDTSHRLCTESDEEEQEEEATGCDTLSFGFRHAVCPFINGVLNVLESWHGLVNRLLSVDTNNLFGGGSDNRWRQIWSNFRNIALALVVIAALVMVVSQAAGMQMLDAYTVRKVLPRLLIAAVGITLSWPLMELAVTISNDLGVGIRSIIYEPFGAGGRLTIDGVDSAMIGLFAGGALFAMGWLALLAAALVLAISIFMLVIMLVLREMLLVLVVVIAPLAIALAILPNTQRFWSMWLKSFVALLIMFLYISAVIAFTRVMAFVALEGSSGTAAIEMFTSVAYFGLHYIPADILSGQVFAQSFSPETSAVAALFAILAIGAQGPLAVKATLVAWATVPLLAAAGAMLANMGKRLSARPKAFIGQRTGENLKRTFQGKRFDENTFLGRTLGKGFNRATEYAGAVPAMGVSGIWKPKQAASRIRSKVADNRAARLKEDMENERFGTIADDTDSLNAGLGGRTSEGAIRDWLLNNTDRRGKDLENTVTRVRNAQKALGSGYDRAAEVAKSGTGDGYKLEYKYKTEDDGSIKYKRKKNGEFKLDENDEKIPIFEKDEKGNKIIVGGGAGELNRDIQRSSGGDMFLGAKMFGMAKGKAGQAGRYDIANASFGSYFKARKKLLQGGKKGWNVQQATAHMVDVALDKKGLGYVLASRGEGVDAFLPAIQRQMDDTIDALANAYEKAEANPTSTKHQQKLAQAQRRFMQAGAVQMGLVDAAQSAAPSEARKMADEFHSHQIDVSKMPEQLRATLDATGIDTLPHAIDGKVTVQQAVNNFVALQPDELQHVLQQMRNDLGVRLTRGLASGQIDPALIDAALRGGATLPGGQPGGAPPAGPSFGPT